MRRALHECYKPGCHELTRETYCSRHKIVASPDTHRHGSSYQRGYNSKWEKARRLFLVDHPFCECPECKASGHPLPANVVDHIIPHKGNSKLFWDRHNWQAMNKRCHDKKTAREDGGFGNRLKR